LLTILAVNCRYIKTNIISEAVIERITAKGAVFASIEDAGEAVLKIAADKKVCGMYTLHFLYPEMAELKPGPTLPLSMY
jgi:hypothetical protein